MGNNSTAKELANCGDEKKRHRVGGPSNALSVLKGEVNQSRDPRRAREENIVEKKAEPKTKRKEEHKSGKRNSLGS